MSTASAKRKSLSRYCRERPHADNCHSFVLAVRQDAANSKGPVHLRSYFNTQQKSLLPNVKAWEASRATSAAPTYFPPMEVSTDKGVKHKLIDAALGANNPVGW